MKEQIKLEEIIKLAKSATVERDHHHDDSDYNVYAGEICTEDGTEVVYKDIQAGAVWNCIEVAGVTFEYCQAWSMYTYEPESFEIGDHSDGNRRIYINNTEVCELPFDVLDEEGVTITADDLFLHLLTHVEIDDFSEFKNDITE